MKMKFVNRLLIAASVVGVLACYPCAEPLQKKKEKERQALIDESDAPEVTSTAAKAPEAAAPQEAAAPDTQTQQANPACEPAEAQKEESGVPVFPIVISAIGTIAFIVLAIIF